MCFHTFQMISIHKLPMYMKLMMRTRMLILSKIEKENAKIQMYKRFQTFDFIIFK
jgi:hypothetical protein